MNIIKQSIYISGFFAVLGYSSHAVACKCEESTVAESVKYSDVIFKGRVINKEYSFNFLPGVKIAGDMTKVWQGRTQLESAMVKIVVDRIYKGAGVSDTVTIITPSNGASCGFSFSIGQEYIVYATKEDETIIDQSIKLYADNNKTFWTNQCTRTKGWFQQEEDAIFAVMKPR